MSESPLFIPRRQKTISEGKVDGVLHIMDGKEKYETYTGKREPYENVIIQPYTLSGYRSQAYTPCTIPHQDAVPRWNTDCCSPAGQFNGGGGVGHVPPQREYRDHYENMEHVYFTGGGPSPHYQTQRHLVKFVPRREAPRAPPVFPHQTLPHHQTPSCQRQTNHLPSNLHPSSSHHLPLSYGPSPLHPLTNHQHPSVPQLPPRGWSTGQDTSGYSSYEQITPFNRGPGSPNSLPMMSEEANHYLSPTLSVHHPSSANSYKPCNLLSPVNLPSHPTLVNRPTHSPLPSQLVPPFPSLILREQDSNQKFLLSRTLIRHYFCLALSTCLICPPCGFWSLYQAFKVDDMVDTGDMQGAELLARKIRKYSVVMMCAGICWISLAIVLFFVLYRKFDDP